MKTLFRLFTVIFLFTASSFSQDWLRLSPMPTVSQLNSVYFLNSNTGFISGNLGAIYKTTDGGTNWQSIAPAGTASLYFYGVYFVDANTGYTCAQGGRIFKTINGGNSWTEQTSGTTRDLHSVWFTDANNGVVVGDNGTILHTANGGTNWTTPTGSTTTSHLTTVRFKSGLGCAVGQAGEIMTSTDGGASWTSHYNPIVSATYLDGVSFADATTGYAVGAGGELLKSIDGGVNWTKITGATTETMNSVWFTSVSTGYAVTTFGKIIKTVNGGANWSQIYSGVSQYLYSVHFIDANNGIAAGNMGLILKTTDAGTTWTQLNRGISQSINGAWFTDSNTGYAALDNGLVMKTTDAGQNWSSLTTNITDWLNAVTFTSASTGYAISGMGYVIKTTNAGSEWATKTIPDGLYYEPTSICFPSAATGYIVSNYYDASFNQIGSAVHKSVDAGETWTLLKNDFPFLNVYSVCFTDNNTGWISGVNGNIVKTIDGGTTWTPQTSGTTQWLRSIYFVNSSLGFACGGNGTILKTIDGGTTWTPKTSGVSTGLNAIRFADAATGFAVGENGLILRSLDGGETWAQQTNGDAPEHLTAIALYGTSGWVFGNSGAAFKNITILPVELASLNLAIEANKPVLRWTTATEVNNYGFEVERKREDASERPAQWEKVGFVKGHGYSNAVREYSFTDNNPLTGKVLYRLKQIDNSGSYEYSDEVAASLGSPSAYKLLQNSPNPFNPSTAIKFQLPQAEHVTIKIFDIQGREVATLLDGEQPAGSHIIYWNGKDNNNVMSSSGIYIYNITAGSFTATRKMSLLK